MNPSERPRPDAVTALSVNLNKVALVRNSRQLDIPSVTRAGVHCLRAGAHGLTVHPRPDERHIRSADVYQLSELLKAWPGREFNIEGNPFHNLMPFVRSLRPQQVTFVPDQAGQSTSDRGWDLELEAKRLRPLIDESRDLGVRVCLFMDPVARSMPLAKALAADRVELYTESYARAFGCVDEGTVLAGFRDAAQAALDAGLGVNAGHDLNLQNLRRFARTVPGLLEVSIGHALMADALDLGYPAAVSAYLRCLSTDGR